MIPGLKNIPMGRRKSFMFLTGLLVTSALEAYYIALRTRISKYLYLIWVAPPCSCEPGIRKGSGGLWGKCKMFTDSIKSISLDLCIYLTTSSYILQECFI